MDLFLLLINHFYPTCPMTIKILKSLLLGLLFVTNVMFGYYEPQFSYTPLTYPYTPYDSYYDSVGFYYGYDFDDWYNQCSCCAPHCYDWCGVGCCNYADRHAPYYYAMKDGDETPEIVSPKVFLWVAFNRDLPNTPTTKQKVLSQKQSLNATRLVDRIPNQNFSGHKNAALLISWKTDNYPFAFSYRVLHASPGELVTDATRLEKYEGILYEGQANHYYLDLTDMHPEKHDYVWVQVLDDNGNVYAESDLILVD